MAEQFGEHTQLRHIPRGVMLSHDYYVEVWSLMNDPILQGMAKELVAAGYDISKWDAYELTLATNREYQVRGGDRFRTIGGPAWALRELVSFYEEQEQMGDA